MDIGALSAELIERGSVFVSKELFQNDNIDHDKFFVIIGEDNDNYVGYFFINSNIHFHIKSTQDFMDMQMPIKRSNYPKFLKYDSFIGCHDLKKVSKERLTEHIKTGTAEFRDMLKQNDLELLLENTRRSKLFSKKEKETYFK